MGLNRTSEEKAVVVIICSKLPYSISSVSVYYGTQSDFREKSYSRLNLLKASVFNFERSIYYVTHSDIPVQSYWGLNFQGAYIFNFERPDIFSETI